jgi:hypothetical protein
MSSILVRVYIPSSLFGTDVNLVALKDEGFSFLLVSPGVVNTAEAPPTDGEMKEIMEMATTFMKKYPHWTGPISPAESVGMMIRIIDGLTVQDSGKFVSHKVSILRPCGRPGA